MKSEVLEPVFYYDVLEARLLVGADSYDRAIESGAHPADLIPLQHILNEPGAYPLPQHEQIKDANKWPRENVLGLITWVGSCVLDEDQPVRQEQFATLRKLGLGPSEKVYRKLGGFLKLYQKADLENCAPERNAYDSWDVDSFTEYVCAFAQRTPASQSLVEAIQQAHAHGKGPSYKIIKQRVDGGLASLLTRGGFYDFRGADDEYYLEWGVDFKFSNNGRDVDSEACSILSPKRRGPARTRITPRFGSMERFNILIQDRYAEEVERVAARNETKFMEIMEAIHTGELPSALFLGCASPDEMRALAGKFQLLTKLCPSMKPETKLSRAGGSAKRLISTIIQSNGTSTAADVESAAIALDVYEDVWPIQRIKNTLKI